MTGDLFKSILLAFDKEMLAKRRRILLFIDNCSAHGRLDEMKQLLKAVNLAYFPPNTTSHLQPLDQGIINSLKVHYRSQMLAGVVRRLETENSLPSVNLLEAINIISHTWNALVTPETIANCFRKAGFRKPDDIEPPDAEEPPDATNVSDEIATVMVTMTPIYETFARLSNMADVPAIDDYVFIDAAALITRQDSDTEIVQTVSEENIEQDQDDSSDEEAADNESEQIPFKSVEASLLQLRKFFINTPDIPESSFRALDEVQRTCNTSRLVGLRQTSIDHFFSAAQPVEEPATDIVANDNGKEMPTKPVEEPAVTGIDTLNNGQRISKQGFLYLYHGFSAEELRYSYYKNYVHK